MRSWREWRISLLTMSLIASTATLAQTVNQQITSEADTSSGLSEIIVTAQRRKESAQSVPVSVDAFDSDTLAKSNILDADDINKVVPSMLMAEGSGTVNPFLRGVGSNIETVGNEGSVALYIDGIYYARIDPGLLRLNSIDQIEAIAGPQGTLFGRNASAGVLQITTREPVPGGSPVLKESLTYSNYQTVNSSLYGSESLGPILAADIAVVYHDQAQGWGRNLYTGGEVYRDRDLDLRSKIVAEPSDATKVVLTLDYERSDSSIGQPNHFFDHVQGYPDGSGMLPQIGFYDKFTNDPAEDWPRDRGISLQISHDFDVLTLRNTAAYRRQNELDVIDSDYSPQNYGYDLLTSVAEQITDELQVISRGEGSFQYTAGFFFLNQSSKYDPTAITGSSVGTGLAALLYGESKSNSYAPYAQGTLQVLPKLKLTVGVRYSIDDMEGNGQTLESYNGAVVYTGPLATNTTKFDKTNYKVALDYEVQPDLLLYASVGSGYKAATYNLLPFDPTPARPETLTAYEVGAKSEWLDRRLRFNAAAFYYDIKSPQVETSTSFATTESNAGAARNYGVDLDTKFAIVRNFNAHFTASYLVAEYTDYTNAPFVNPNPTPPYGNLPTVPGDADGKSLPYAPRFSLSTGGDYTLPTSAGDFVLSGNYYHNSGIFFLPDNRIRQPAYGILDAQLSFAPTQNHLKFRIYGSNLTNTQYYMKAYQLNGNAGDVGNPGAPRTYGIGVDYSL
jgi:iron complex outermembrane recepter protein